MVITDRVKLLGYRILDRIKSPLAGRGPGDLAHEMAAPALPFSR
jgi:hypothetical protein